MTETLANVTGRRSKYSVAPLSGEFLDVLYGALWVGDIVLVFLGGYIAYEGYAVRFGPAQWVDYVRNIAFGALLAPFVFQRVGLYRVGLYRDGNLKSARETFRLVIISAGALFCLLLTLGFATHSILVVSRIWAGWWFVAVVTLLVGGHLVVTQILRALVSKGMIVDTVAIVGANHRAAKVVSYLESSRFAAAKVVGIFDDRVSPRDPACIPARGTITDLLELGKSSRIDRIVIALPWSAERRLIEIVHRLKALSADIVLCPGEFALALRRKEVDYIADVPVFRVAPRPLASWKHVLKEAEDKTLSILLLVALFPFMAGIAIAIRASSRGPIIFKQTRHGFNNSEFDVYKFRTMKIEALDYSGARQTARKDARLTGVGAFLRKTSFDELPQLFNVLKGEMSLVGPRPHPLGMRTRDRLCHEIAADYAHRHRMKPGITGWAQVNGYRGPTELPDQLLRRLEYDLHYIENWSLALDVIVLVKTLGQIFPSERSF